MPYIGYAFILLVCLEVILVCFNKVNPKVYPFLLYGIGAGMVLMTSLAGPYLIGTDIHLEYYYAQLRAGKDVVQPTVGLPQGTSIITYITDNIWVWKVVYPLLFTSIPVILYFVFKKWFTPTQAFLASFFFITFPAFPMELPSIARQMAAEFVLAILLYLLVASNLKVKYKIPLVVACGALLPLFHYAVGMVTLILLGAGLLFRSRRKLVGIGLAATVITSAIYFPMVEDGAVTTKLAFIYNNWVPTTITFMPTIPAPELPSPPYLSPEWSEYPPEIVPLPGIPLIDRYEVLLRSGFGLDFLQTTVPGKIFRILQWIILILMMVGIWRLRRNKEYWVFAGGGILSVFLLLIPGFSSLLGATRFLHLSLFLLAPLLAVALRPKYLLIILVPYFLFTSGFVFEVTKQPDIEEITIPYSVSLSDHRIDLGASTTEDDKEVRDYIYENKLFPIFTDTYGDNLIAEMTGWRADLSVAFRRVPISFKGYVFVRSRNIKDGTFTVWNGVGCRKYINPEEYGIDWNKNIIYQKGDSRLIWVE